MPLAAPKNSIPTVEKPAEVKVVSSESPKDLREQSKILGQIRTHLMAHAMPMLMSTIEIDNDDAVKALIIKWAKFVETGE